jgi:hypothetical protein
MHVRSDSDSEGYDVPLRSLVNRRYSEDGSSKFLRNVNDSVETTRRNIPEDDCSLHISLKKAKLSL